MRSSNFLLTTLGFLLCGNFAFAPDLVDLEKEYYQKKDQIRYEYRVGLAKQLKLDTTKIEVILLQFDGNYENEPELSDDEVFYSEAKETWAPILKRVVVTDPAVAKVLKTELIATLEKKEHRGGAMCHDPVHAIRITLDGESRKRVEMTFCWACYNIGFPYPDGFEYLDTTEGLKAAFANMVSIPQSEMERFKDRAKWIPKSKWVPKEDEDEDEDSE